MTDMDRSTEMDLMRLLNPAAGELPLERERELRARLAREPELGRRYRRLAARWEQLELPPPAAPPPGFAGRVMAHVRSAAGEGAALSWSLAPTWVRAAAAAALVGGMALGAGLGLLPARSTEAPPGTADLVIQRVPLADSYWSVFEEAPASAARDAMPAGGPDGAGAPGGEAQP
jgi:hypothetical protein